MKITGNLSFESPDKPTALDFVAAFIGYARASGWDVDDVEVSIWAPGAENCTPEAHESSDDQ